jgi:diguanylate cyclase (GGDEF)-like protein
MAYGTELAPVEGNTSLRGATVDQTTKDDIRAFVSEYTSHSDLMAAVADVIMSTMNSDVDSETLVQSVSNALRVAAEAEHRIADQAARIAEMESMALFDELTGILNRRGFINELERALADARRRSESGVLIYIDLDGFKAINDTLGHSAGDDVLRHAAQVLRDNVRSTDSVGRLGGDEFGVLLTRTTRKDGIARAEALEQLLNSSTVMWGTRLVSLRASFGIRAYSGRDDGGSLLNGADEAMYRAKRARSEALSGPRVAA